MRNDLPIIGLVYISQVNLEQIMIGEAHGARFTPEAGCLFSLLIL